jgi:hypothetical protein
MVMRFLVATGIALAQLVFAQEIQTVQVTSGINGPTDIQNAGDGSGRLFLVQQNGIVRILRDGTLAPQPFPGHHWQAAPAANGAFWGSLFRPGSHRSGAST